MNYLPIFANLKNSPVLVVGAGEVACRKIELLLQAKAQVGVIAQQLGSGVQQLVDQARLVWLKKSFVAEDVNQAVLTIAATDDAALNRSVAQAGHKYHRLVNVVDNPSLCRFIVPAIVDRSPVQIAVSTGGAAPVLARQIRQKLEQDLPSYLGDMAHIAQQARPVVKARLPSMTARRVFWEKLFDHPSFAYLTASKQFTQASQFIAEQLQQSALLPTQGHVSLVGAGPGDAGLLTLKGYQALQAADVVLYDALVADPVLELARRDALKIAVGKRAHSHSVPQEHTNQLLVQYAQQGLRVVRLKGGDPFVFGRGAEEVEVLKHARIAYTVVPGITAALGATASAGIPLTHRDYAQAVSLITGQCSTESHSLDWASLARDKQTLVIYMGTLKAAEIRTQLLQQGKAATTPVAIISKGTLADQQVRVGQLHELTQLAQTATRTALIVIGEVVKLRTQQPLAELAV